MPVPKGDWVISMEDKMLPGVIGSGGRSGISGPATMTQRFALNKGFGK